MKKWCNKYVFMDGVFWRLNKTHPEMSYTKYGWWWFELEREVNSHWPFLCGFHWHWKLMVLGHRILIGKGYNGEEARRIVQMNSKPLPTAKSMFSNGFIINKILSICDTKRPTKQPAKKGK